MLDVLTVLSLLASVGLALLAVTLRATGRGVEFGWLTSHFEQNDAGQSGGSVRCVVECSAGRIMAVRYDEDFGYPDPDTTQPIPTLQHKRQAVARWLEPAEAFPYGWQAQPEVGGVVCRGRLNWIDQRIDLSSHSHFRTRAAVLPIEAVIIASGLVPALRFYRRGRRRCAAAGRCTRCGYSLTGNISGVCPECGTKVIAPR